LQRQVVADVRRITSGDLTLSSGNVRKSLVISGEFVTLLGSVESGFRAAAEQYKRSVDAFGSWEQAFCCFTAFAAATRQRDALQSNNGQ